MAVVYVVLPPYCHDARVVKPLKGSGGVGHCPPGINETHLNNIFYYNFSEEVNFPFFVSEREDPVFILFLT